MDHAELAARFIDGRTRVGRPTCSPDGTHTAYVVATDDLEQNTTIARVWLDDAPVTAGPRDADPVWSPDGRWLAFTSRRAEAEGGKKSDATLHVLPVDGPGEVRTACVMPDGIGDAAWSPDGRWLAFTSRTQDERYTAKDVSWQSPRRIERFFSRLNGEDWVFDRPSHVYVVAADGTGRPRNLTPGEFQHDGVAWLRDSSGVITNAQRHDTWDLDQASDLYLVPLDGEIRALTHQTGAYGAASVSPDGTHVAFLGHDDPSVSPQNLKVGVLALDDGAGGHRWISEGLDRTFAPMTGAQPPHWTDDTTLLALAEDRGEVHLYRLGLDARMPERVTDGPITVHGFDVARNGTGGTIVLARSTVDRSSDLVTLGGGPDGDGDEQPVTTFARPGRGWEKFTVPCADGTGEIDAWIMRPDQHDARSGAATRYPVLLNVHGGPFAQYGETWFDEAQIQAEAGFVVVVCNPRGSSGRDTAWGQAINGTKHPTAPGTGWGSVDVDDVLGVLDATLDRFPECDPDRIGMLGGSYGGYMATMLAARHGHRFRAICSERAANNLLAMEWSSDIVTAFRAVHGRSAVEDPDEYLRMSPSALARDIHVPMLLIHSEEDWRCPINQAEELWVTLKLLGRDVTFYRFPGENHELSRGGSPVHRRMRAEIILDFFGTHLPTSDLGTDGS